MTLARGIRDIQDCSVGRWASDSMRFGNSLSGVKTILPCRSPINALCGESPDACSIR